MAKPGDIAEHAKGSAAFGVMMLPALMFLPVLHAWSASHAASLGSATAWNAFAVATIGSVAVAPRAYGWALSPRDLVTPALGRMLGSCALGWFWMLVIGVYLGRWSTYLLGRAGRALWIGLFFTCALAVSFATIFVGKSVEALMRATSLRRCRRRVV